MFRSIRLFAVSLIVAGAFVGVGARVASASQGAGQQDTAQVQVLHRAFGAGTVDVYVNGAKAIAGFKEGDSTGFIPLPEGTYKLEVKPAGRSNTILSATAKVQGGESYTVTATLGGLVIAQLGSGGSDGSGGDDD